MDFANNYGGITSGFTVASCVIRPSTGVALTLLSPWFVSAVTISLTY